MHSNSKNIEHFNIDDFSAFLEKNEKENELYYNDTQNFTQETGESIKMNPENYEALHSIHDEQFINFFSSPNEDFNKDLELPDLNKVVKIIDKAEKEKKEQSVNKPKGNLGRKKKGTITTGNYHSKNRKDNRKNKIKTHFFNFVIDFTNLIIKGNWVKIHNSKFRKISHKEKSNTSIETNKQLFQQSIKDVLLLDVSSKYKDRTKQNIKTLETLNKKLIKKQESFEKFNNFLNFPLAQFYEEVYLANSDRIQDYLIEYGITRNQKQKVQFFREFIKEKELKGEDSKYLANLTKEGEEFVGEYNTKLPKPKKYIYTNLEYKGNIPDNHGDTSFDQMKFSMLFDD